MPRDGLPLPLLLGLVFVLGLGLFLLLEGHRQRPRDMPLAMVATPMIPELSLAEPVREAPVRAVAVQAMAPPAAMRAVATMPYSAPYSPPVGLVGEEPLVAPHAPRPAGGRAEHGGALVLDLTQGGGVPVNGAAEAAPAEDVVRAAPMRGRATIMAQGTMLDAVLETPLNSDRPGLARAIVGEDVRGFDGSRILIPRGSRLIGEFKADTNPGQRRVLVSWTRLIRPDGVAIRIASPAVDPLGGAGVPGSVNTHFVERFSAAVLQSALAVGVNVASTLPVQGAGAVYLGLPAQQMGGSLTQGANRVPTVKVREGTRIAVLVAHDLDFSGTPAWR
jgi:type IV secretion system protein VirB10